MSPVAVYLPEWPMNMATGPAPTSVYYYGNGYQTQTSVYAMVTGAPGQDSGPATTYLYEEPSGMKYPHVQLTADPGNGTITAFFDLACSAGSTYNGWQCKAGYETSGKTSLFTTYRTNVGPNTMVTPVVGQIDQMQQSTASFGPSGVPSFAQASLNKYAHSGVPRAAPRWLACMAALAATVVLGACAL